eukprot:1616029-Prymnesium_polylepis.1
MKDVPPSLLSTLPRQSHLPGPWNMKLRTRSVTPPEGVSASAGSSRPAKRAAAPVVAFTETRHVSPWSSEYAAPSAVASR